MFVILFRFACLLVGGVLLVEAWLPTRLAQVSVDRHSRPSTTLNPQFASDAPYKLHLVGGTVSSCSVGHRAYSSLNDGDAISVQATRLTRSCVRIVRDGEVIEADTNWRLIATGIALLTLAVAFGWLRADYDGDGLHIPWVR